MLQITTGVNYSRNPKKNKNLFVFSLLLHFLCTAFFKKLS